MTWGPSASTPMPAETAGSTGSAVAAGTALTLFVVFMVSLAVLFAWLAKYRGRRQPNARPSDKPFRPT